MNEVHSREEFQALTQQQLEMPNQDVHNLLRNLANEAAKFFPLEVRRFDQDGNKLHEDHSRMEVATERSKQLKEQRRTHYSKNRFQH